VGEAIAMATSSNARVLLVRFPSGRWMAVERSQLEHYGEADGRGRKLSDVLTADWLPTVHPDQPLDAAIGFVQGRAVVPVVSRADPGKLEGVLTLEDILETYKEASDDSRSSSHSVP
jgi:hypothetical protein